MPRRIRLHSIVQCIERILSIEMGVMCVIHATLLHQNLLQFYNQLVKLAKGCIKDGPKGTPQAKLKFVNIKDKQLDMSALERA